MRSWDYHYEMAEKLLNKANDPSTLLNAKNAALALAQVHATLASIRYDVRKGTFDGKE